MHQLAISSASPPYLPYISQEMHQLAVLPTELVGTYSCHGIDSNQDKINQDAACICYPLTGDPHSAALIVVDGDVIRDPRVLMDERNVKLVVKAGEVVKCAL